MAFLTIITPTYNRAHTLSRCYESLQQQTCFDFEWILVDDGSTDSTQSLVEGFISNDFQIIKIRKENGGKHTALNAVHPYVHGDYVLILDSDDNLIPSAVEQIKAAWTQWQTDTSIGIVTFLKGDSESKPTCIAPDEGVPVDIMRYRRKCFYSSDCCEVIRAELFLKYSFPVFEGEHFLSECALWNRVSLTHRCVYVNHVIYLCDYQPDGLTKSGRKLRVQNPRGGMYTANLNMHQKNFFYRRVKNGLLFTCYGFFAGESPLQMLQHSDHKLLSATCMPFGRALYHYWKYKTNK